MDEAGAVRRRQFTAVSAVCRQLTDLRDIAGAIGEGPELERLARALLDEADPADHLAALDELLRRAGVPGGLLANGRGPAGGLGLPPLGGGHPVAEVLSCPAGRCDRVELPSDTEPWCALGQLPLRKVRV